MEALQRNVQAVSQKQEVAELKTKGGRAQFGVLVDIKTHIDMAEAALRAAMGAPEKFSLDYFNSILGNLGKAKEAAEQRMTKVKGPTGRRAVTRYYRR